MAGHGGKRPGSGRKPLGYARVLHENPVRAAEKRIVDRLPWLVDKLMELAEGIYQEKTLRDGVTTVVYQQPPDRSAIEYLVDRVMGKATQPIDILNEVDQIAAEYGVEPERVTSIVERLRQKRTG